METLLSTFPSFENCSLLLVLVCLMLSLAYSRCNPMKPTPPCFGDTPSSAFGNLNRAATSENAADLPESAIDMHQKYVAIMVATLALAGCAVPLTKNNDPTRIGNVPEAVADLAAPDQDLTTARLRPEDGCYWYEHSGPVETTLVPLRSTGGSPICVARQT